MQNSQRTSRELTLYVVLFITACAILGAMLFILRSGDKMIAKISPLADATMEVGMDAAQAHLYLMEAALEDNHLHLDTALGYLRRADLLLKAMLDGGTVGSVTIPPLEDPEMRQKVGEIRRSIVHLLIIKPDDLPGLLEEHLHGKYEHTHDAVFAGLLHQTAAVETQLRQVITSEHTYFRHVQITLISVCVGFFLIVTSVLYRYLSARKRYEARINRLNLILRAVRNVNHLITREKDTDRLIQTTCELLVEDRGFLNAWLTLLDETGKPTVQAEAGLGEDFAPALRKLEKGELLPCCMKALKNDGVVVVEDPHRDCPDCPLSEMYTGRSGLAVRLEHAGRIYGFMIVSSPRNYAFDTEEHNLFAELGEDIALSLHVLAIEKERTRAEAALRESEERYRTLAANIPNIDIYLFDKDLRYLVAEGTEMRKNGLSSEFYEGKTLGEAWDENMAAILGPSYVKALKGESASAEYLCCNKHYSLTAVPVYNGGREVVGGIALTENITERKRAERALRLTRFSIDHAADAVFWCSSDGRLLDTNPAASTLLGFTREEFLKMRAWDIDPSFPLSKFKEQWKVYRECGAVTVETSLRTKDNRLVPVETQANHVAFEGQEYICSFVRDISERKRAEEALKRSEGLLRHTFEAIPDLITVHDPDFNVVLSNWHGHETVSKTKGDLSQRCYSAYMKRTKPCEPCLTEQVFVTRKPARMEVANPMDGTVCEVNVYPVIDDAGNVTMVTEHIRDVTEQRRAEKLQSTLLQISEATNLTPNLDELLRIIHEALGNLIDTTNFYVALYDSNTGGYTFPYSVDEVDGIDFSPEQLKMSLTDYVRRTGKSLLADQKIHNELQKRGEVKLVGNPSQVWLGVPLTTAHGTIGVVAVQSYDNPNLYGEVDKELLVLVSGHITMAVERKLAEEALRKSEERLRAMYEQASVGVALLDFDGRWLAVNERLCEILSYSRQELLRMNCRDVTHPEDSRDSECIIDRAVKVDDGKCTCEKRYIRKDGSMVWVNVSAAVVHEPADQEKYLIVIIQDISERKSAEEMVARYTERLIRANRALEAKQAELEEFVHTVSHDLKAPIVSISGFAGLVKEKLSGHIDESSARQLERILHNATVMEQLIGDLLELSRIGRTDEPETVINVDQLATDVMESFSVTAKGKNVKLTKVGELPYTVGRYQRVRQLFSNLVDNAIKYMPDKRDARIEIGFDDDVTSPHGIKSAYYVRDNGVGIPEDFHERVFHMFQRVNPNDGQSKGSGVGLTIVKRIVQKHGGEVWLSSNVGQGSIFYFTLPANHESDSDTIEHKELLPELNLSGTEKNT